MTKKHWGTGFISTPTSSELSIGGATTADPAETISLRVAYSNTTLVRLIMGLESGRYTLAEVPVSDSTGASEVK